MNRHPIRAKSLMVLTVWAAPPHAGDGFGARSSSCSDTRRATRDKRRRAPRGDGQPPARWSTSPRPCVNPCTRTASISPMKIGWPMVRSEAGSIVNVLFRTKEELPEIAKGNKTVYVWVFVRYKDTIKDRRFAQTCSMFHAQWGRTSPCPSVSRFLSSTRLAASRADTRSAPVSEVYSCHHACSRHGSAHHRMRMSSESVGADLHSE
jgi:hypothetical protein